MRIGLSYDLKEAVPLGQGQPDDALEEYDSLETVEAISQAFQSRAHSVVKLGGGGEFLRKILTEQVDLVFNIAEGRGNYRSREAQVPSILEMLNIPYSGSDPQSLTVCQDKPLSKKILTSYAIRTPNWLVFTGKDDLGKIACDDIAFPVFIKPVYEGSSKGIRFSSRIDNFTQLVEVAAQMLELYRQPVMMEEFIAGEEITVGVIGNCPPKVVGIMRVVPRKKDANFVYSLEVKRQWESLVDYECPARLKADILQEITDASLTIFQVLGCRDFARLDFRISQEGLPYFLEINPLPGLNPKNSDLPIMASKIGLAYKDLVLSVLHSTLERYPQCV